MARIASDTRWLTWVMVACAYVGRDQKYLDVAINFTNDVFVSSFIINLFPDFLKPCVAYFSFSPTKS